MLLPTVFWDLFFLTAWDLLQGDPSARRLGYADINSVSLGVYPETELSQHKGPSINIKYVRTEGEGGV